MSPDVMQFVQTNIWLILIAVVSGGMLVWPAIRHVVGGSHEVSTLEATQLINRRDAIVVDVREPGEYANGHIPGAKHIPLANLAARLKELEKFKQRPIVVTCAGGNRSGTAIGILRKGGFNEAVNLKGGIAAWQQASLPLEKR
ncbi:MAG: rhodanese-like domain-containing protein [Burkholderiales bacterium]